MKINVTKSSLPSFEEYCDEIKDIWDDCWLTNNGKKHKLLETKLKAFLECENLALFVNGHSALESIIASYNFPLGSEIITTPFTFISTTNAIIRNGLVPIFCDIKNDDFTLDASKIEKLITKKTVAILPVHVYGNICDIEQIASLAKKYNLKVIYDAAHAFGTRYNGKPISSFGDASMFSFHATKVFNTIEGGCVVVNDNSNKQCEKMNFLKNFGFKSEEECVISGCNAKMNEFQASMGLCNLRHIDEYILKRKEVYKRYCERLLNKKGIGICEIKSGIQSNYSYFPVLFDKKYYSRDEIKSKLEKYNIYTRKYFYPLTSDFECNAVFNKNNTPIAKRISENILTLPMYSDLSLQDVDLICNIILGE